jgi:hypothetical protein
LAQANSPPDYPDVSASIVCERKFAATVVPAKERVKKIGETAEIRPQRHPRESGDQSKSLFHIEKWIPAFAHAR